MAGVPQVAAIAKIKLALKLARQLCKVLERAAQLVEIMEAYEGDPLEDEDED